MAAAAVSTTSTATDENAAPTSRNTLTLPTQRRPAPAQPAAEVVLFDAARADLPRPYTTSDAQAEAARQQWQEAQERERLSRQRGAEILRRRRAGELGADGDAMLARPHKTVRIAFLSDDTLEAALARQFADAHLIDRMWDQGQLNDWQYATANRLLQLCDAAGLLASRVAQVGRIGSGHAEMSDGMAQARRQLNRLLQAIGSPGDELLSSLCLGELSYRGQASRAEALKAGLAYLARHWGIDRC